MNLDLKVKLLHPLAKGLKQAKPGDAGYDIFPIESGTILPQESCPIQTGFATSFNMEWAAVIIDRGSTGFKGLMHQAGLIDSNFRGQWVIRLYNSSMEPFSYSPKKAIAQVVFLYCSNEEAKIVEELPGSVRMDQWLGSSDK